MRKLYIYLITVLISNILNAQDLIVAQKMVIGKMAVDNEKNILVSGYFSGTFDFDFSLNKAEITSWKDGNGSDMFIASYDSLLNYNWAFSYGPGSDQNIYNILTDKYGNIYVNGFAYKTTDFDPSADIALLSANSNGEVSFLAKYDKAGNFKWVKNFDEKLILVLNNSFYGNSSNTISKYDFNGNEIWRANIPNRKAPVFDKKSQFYFLTDSTQSEYYQRPLSICAIDTLGKLKFKKELTQSSNSKFSGCKLYFVNEKLVISGGFWGDVDMDPQNSSNIITNTKMYELFQRGQYTGIWVPDFRNFLAEYDPKGNLIFVNDHYVVPSLIKSDKSGNVFIVGSFLGSVNLDLKNSEKISLSTIGFANYLAEYDSDFNIISAVKLSEIDISQMYIVTPYVNDLYFSSNYAIMVGRFNNLHLSQGAILYPNYPEFYIAIYKNFQISPLIMHSNVGINSSSISIYPNPAIDKFTIEIPQMTEIYTLTIYDINGQAIDKQLIKEIKTQIDISNLKNGMYFLKLNTDKIEIIRKLIKG